MLAENVCDMLNSLVSTIDAEDQESVVVKCCLACAIEELENYIHTGAFVPSVMPVASPIPSLQAHPGLTREQMNSLSSVVRDALVTIFPAKDKDSSVPLSYDTTLGKYTLSSSVLDQCERGMKLHAIKQLRSELPLSLLEAKGIVDKIFLILARSKS